MLSSKRASIAFICALKLISSHLNAIYDCTNNKYYFYLFKERGLNNSSIYNYETGNQIAGKLPQLFDYATGNYIHLAIKGNRAQGFDYQTNNFFLVNITGKMITIFDYGENNYFNYLA